jgi:arsenical pump membrane protein
MMKVPDCGPFCQNWVPGAAAGAGGPRRTSASGMRTGRLIRCGLVTGRKGIARVLRSARLAPLDWVSLGVFALGLLMVATGLLPLGDASHTLGRILPLVGFLAAVIVLAELTAEAQLFDIVATRLAIIARGSFAAMFALCVIFAATATAALNLDTTAVLLTPVMLAVAGPADIPPVPLAMTTVWLANTASLLLPVSNLTNLLAMNRLALTAPGFASRMYLPELASVAATVACLWIMYWRRGLRPSDRYRMPEPYEPRDPLLTGLSAAACTLFVVLVLLSVPLAVAALSAVCIVIAGFAARSRSSLSPRLIPWQLLTFVIGLFLVIQVIDQHGLGAILSSAIGSDPGAPGVWRAAGLGAGLSNVVNNLPAYVAGEAAVGGGNHDQLLGLLIGTNVGPLVAPWASLATMLWYARCRAKGLEISWRRFAGTGAITAIVSLSAATGALLLTR